MSDQTAKLITKQNFLEKSRDASNRSEEELDLVCFSIQDETYGIELSLLQEILKVKNITIVPQGPDALIGIINLRGVLISIVNFKKCLGVKEPNETSDQSRILIVDYKRRLTGILVDQVQEIVRIHKKRLADPPEESSHPKDDMIAFIAKLESEEIIIPNLEKLFQS